MTVASPLAFPGGRVVAGWWRQLAASATPPRSVAVGHLFLHEVEALVAVTRTTPLDSFRRLVLHALTLTPGKTAVELDAALHLGVQVLHRLLEQLQADGLARAEAGGRWQASAAGQRALQAGEFS